MAMNRNSGPKPISSSPGQFQFPANYHLIVTTETQVLLMARKDIQSLLVSPTGGILVAREAKDRSGNIAIADEQTVLIHKSRTSPGRTYKLHAAKVYKLFAYSVLWVLIIFVGSYSTT